MWGRSGCWYSVNCHSVGRTDLCSQFVAFLFFCFLFLLASRFDLKTLVRKHLTVASPSAKIDRNIHSFNLWFFFRGKKRWSCASFCSHFYHFHIRSNFRRKKIINQAEYSMSNISVRLSRAISGTQPSNIRRVSTQHIYSATEMSLAARLLTASAVDGSITSCLELATMIVDGSKSNVLHFRCKI